MSVYNHLELARQIDGLIYQFDRKSYLMSGKVGYQRRDKGIWITYRDANGWVIYDEESQEITGKSWDVLPQDQDPDYPPEGEWVSKKGKKSYVYTLTYLSH